MERRRSNSGALALVAIVVLVVFASSGGKKKGKGSTPKVLPTGKQVDLVKTSPSSSATWARTRYVAAFIAAKANGATDDNNAIEIALSMLTHWAIETGNGAGEINFNVGNINAYGNQDYVLVHDVDGTIHAQRTFATLEDGINAYVGLLRQSRYAAAAAELANNPTSSDWFIALGRAGWFDPTKAGSTWEAARSMYESRRKLLEQYAEAES